MTQEDAETPEDRLHPVDEAIVKAAFTGEGLIEITSTEMLMGMAEAATKTGDHFLQLAAEIVTIDRAACVRKLRVDYGYTWRAIAQKCYDAWDGEQHDWSPPSNQLMGMALCEVAAKLYGEDYMNGKPWN